MATVSNQRSSFRWKSWGSENQRPGRNEVSRVAVQALHHSFALGIRGRAEVHPGSQGPGVDSERLGRSRIAGALVGAECAFSVEHEGAWDAPEDLQPATQCPQQVGSGLAEHQRATADPGIAEHTGEHVATAQVSEAHGDPDGGLPQIPLDDPSRQVGGALVGPGPAEQRPDLHEVLVQDRLAAPVALLDQDLEDAFAGDLRILVEQTQDLALEWVELGGSPRAAVRRRLV